MPPRRHGRRAIICTATSRLSCLRRSLTTSRKWTRRESVFSDTVWAVTALWHWYANLASWFDSLGCAWIILCEVPQKPGEVQISLGVRAYRQSEQMPLGPESFFRLFEREIGMGGVWCHGAGWEVECWSAGYFNRCGKSPLTSDKGAIVPRFGNPITNVCNSFELSRLDLR